jgi:hypothetical protein
VADQRCGICGLHTASVPWVINRACLVTVSLVGTTPLHSKVCHLCVRGDFVVVARRVGLYIFYILCIFSILSILRMGVAAVGLCAPSFRSGEQIDSETRGAPCVREGEIRRAEEQKSRDPDLRWGQRKWRRSTDSVALCCSAALTGWGAYCTCAFSVVSTNGGE